MAVLFIAGFIAAGALGQVGSLSISGSSASSDSSSTSTDTTAPTDATQTSTDSTTSETTPASDTTTTSTDTTTASTDTTSTTATTTASSPRAYYLVKFAAGTSTADQTAALNAAGATDLSYIAPLRLHSVSFPADSADLDVAKLSADASVTRVEVDKSRDVAGSPNDADYGQQWSLPRIGWDQVYGNVTPGGSATVAILDTGVDASHPDLAGKVVAGTNVLTHSGNGEDDPNGHGTAMAGIVAAATNNDIGIAGVGYAGVRVMPVTVLDAQGLGQDSDIIEGVVYAADHGANVILMSFSNPGYSASLQDAVDYAWSHGLVVVAATGNDGSSTVNFPAGDRGVMGVGSTDPMDVPSSFSNAGADVFLAAPGENILSTTLDGYGSITGTSAAAAEVAGAAALIKASSVGATNGVIVNRLAESADASGTGTQTGNGRLNLARAIADTSSNSIEPAGAAPVGGGGPYVGPYVAAAGTRTTSTVVDCNSTSAVAIGTARSCTVTVTDTATGSKSNPTGTFNVTASGASVSPTSASCVLTPSGNAGAVCSVSFTGGATGTITVTASYPGDGAHAASSDTDTITVKRNSSTSVSCPDVVIGQASSCTITVTDPDSGLSTPTGSVSLSASGASVSPTSASCTLSGGGNSTSCTASFTGGATGTISVTASYPGDTNHVASSGSDSITVSKRATSTSVSCASPVLPNAASSCTVTVSDTSGGSATTPTGTVSLTASGAGASPASTTCNLSGSAGTATCSANFTGNAAGTITLNASYPGDTTHATSSGSGSITVSLHPTTTAVSCASPVAVGAASSCTITVTDTSASGATTPGGTVNLTASGAGASPASTSCTLSGSGGSATCSASFTGSATGTISVSATYAGDSAHTTSSGSGSITVNKRATSTTVACNSPIALNGTSDCIATVNDTSAGTATTPTGTVSFTASGGGVSPTSASCTLSGTGSSASCSVTFTGGSTGTISVSASYAGDGTHLTSSGSGSIDVKRASSTSVSCASPVIVGQASSCTVTVMDSSSGGKTTPTGTFNVTASGAGVSPTSASCVLSGGGASATCAVSFTGSVAGTITVSAPYPGDANHAASSGTASITVNAQAPTSLAVSPATGTYGGTADLTATLTSGGSGVNVKTISFSLNGNSVGTAATNASGVATLAGVSLSGINAGTYTNAVSATFAGDSGYSSSSGSGNLAVAKANQTITFNALADKTFGDADFTVSATASSGLTVSFAASGNCTVSGSTVHITGAGSCTITASQGGSSNYNAAADVSRSFSIAKAQATLALSNLNQTYDGSAKAVTVTTTPSGLSGVSVTYDGAATAPTNAGSYAVVASLTNPNYQAANATGALVIAKASQAISFAALANKTYGDPDFTVSATASSGLPVSFSAAGNCTVSGSSVHITGAGSCTVTASQGGNSNYNAAADVSRSFSIAKAQATLALSNLNQTYDGSAKAVTVTTTPSGLSGVSVTYNGSAAAPTNAGSYAVLASLSNANYQAADATGTLVVAKASQAISFAALADKTYGDADFTVSATASSGLPVSFSVGASDNCTISGATVHITGAGACTVTASQGGNSNYNAAVDVARAFSIAKASQTISFAALADKTYGDADFSVSASASSGLAVSFAATGDCTVSGATVHITGAGTCTITASQGGNANYNAAPDVSRSFSIAKASQTITFAALADKTYGDPDFTVSATASSGLPVSFSVGASDNCTISGATVHITGAGSCTVTASQGGNSNYNAAVDVARAFSIAKASQTISFAALAGKTYGDADFTVSASASSGLAVSFSAAGNCTVSGSTVHITGAGSCTITASQGGNANYNAAPDVSRSFSIAKASQTITFAALADKTYGDADFTVSATASSGLPVSFSVGGSDNCTISGATVHITGAGSCTVTASQGGNSNYNAAADVSRSFSIAKAQATLALSNLNQTYDGSAKAVTVTTTPSGLSGVSVTYDGSAAAPMNAGSYAVVASLSNANYDAADATGTLVIAKANQTITFNALAGKTYGDADFTVSASASSGLAVSFSAAGDCTVSGSTVHIAGAGSCTVTASQGGNANYEAAADVSRSFSIAKAQATLALSDLNQTYDGSAKPVPVTTTPSGLSGVSVSYDGSATAPTNAGSYAVVASLSNANYQAADATGTLVIAKANQTITFNALADKTFGDADFAVSASASSGLTVSFAATGDCTVSGATVHITGAGSCTITASQSGNGNYNAAADVSRSFSIAKAQATLALSNLNQTYDGSPKPVAVTTTPSGLSGVSVSYDGSATAPTNAGSYAVVASLSNANYQAADATGTLVIAKANQTITFNALADKTFGDPDFTVSGTSSSGLAVAFSAAGDCTVSGGTVHITGAGSCTVTASQGGNANYEAAADVSRSFSIAKAQATLSFAAGTLGQTYDASPRAVTVDTSPSGLSGVSVTYDGSATAPTDAGSYAVAASLSNANYQASPISGTLIVAKASQTITFAALAGKTYGDADFTVSASASSGLAISFSAAGDCTVSGATVHITGAGSCTVTASQGGSSNYNAAADVSRSFSIAKAQATLALSNLSQTYDGSAKAVTVTTTPSGLSGVSVSYDGSATAPTNAGSYAVVASLSNANYQATDATGTLVVAKANQTITFDALTGKTYGDADFTVSASASSELAVSFSATGNCTVSGSSVHITGAGSCTVTASQAGNSNYKAAADVSRSFSIAKASQTISFAALADKTYGDADFSVSATASSGLTVSFSATGYCTVSGSTVHIAGAGSCTITASQGGNTNYNAAQDVARTFSIAKASQAISFAALANKTYGDSDFTVSATVSSGLPVSFSVGAGDDCTISGATVHITGAGSCTVTASQGGNSNYNAAADVSRSFSIAKAQATLALSNLNQTYDGSAKVATVSTTPSGLSGVSVTYDGSATAPTNAGSYAVVASLSNRNYQAADATGTLVVAKANQTITFAALANKTYGDADFSVSATASSGLSVSFSATGNCSVSGATVHITGAGSCTITASQGGNGNYNAAPDVARTFSIAKANQTITFNALADKTYGDADFTVSATAASYLPVSFSAAGNCTVSGSTVHITGAGSCTITASQGGNANYNAAPDFSRSFSIAKAEATLTIDPSSLSKTYNGSPQGVSVSTSPNGLSGVSVTYAGSATVPTNAGSYAVVASLSNANYQATDATGTLVIAKANQAISFAALADKTYGDPDFTISSTASSGLAVSFSATGNCTVSGATVHITGAGTCTITASQGGNGNYNAAQDVARTFSIAKANQTITFAALANKTYGDADFTVSATASSGLPASFSAAGNCTVSGTTVHITGMGSCTITGSQVGNSNYNAAPDVSRSFSIAKAVLQVEPAPKTPSRQYSDPNPSFSPTITGYKNGDGAGALTTAPTCATTATTTSAPGTYPITCSGGAAANYSFNYTAGTLTVTQEDAAADFSGALFYAVPSGSATVTLSATITDAADGNRGDVRNAKVTFLVDGTAKCSSLPVGLVSSGDTTVGAATCNVSLGYGSTGSTQYTIAIRVDGFYSRYSSDDDAVVTVSQAISSMITGGGFLKNTASSGLFAGTAGLKTNFGFNVKYNKSNTNLQGNINTIVRSDGRVYQIKGNSMTSLSNQVNSSTGQGGTSTFNGKASIQDITNPAAPISLDGNASLQVTMADNGEPGANDTIGITVWNKNGGLWFSSNWNGTKTLEQLLGGGNLVVR